MDGVEEGKEEKKKKKVKAVVVVAVKQAEVKEEREVKTVVVELDEETDASNSCPDSRPCLSFISVTGARIRKGER